MGIKNGGRKGEKEQQKKEDKKEAIKRQKGGQLGAGMMASAPDAEAGKEGFRAAGLVRPDLFSTPSPS